MRRARNTRRGHRQVPSGAGTGQALPVHSFTLKPQRRAHASDDRGADAFLCGIGHLQIRGDHEGGGDGEIVKGLDALLVAEMHEIRQVAACLQ